MKYDTIGSLKLYQSLSGVKASVDGVLLARFRVPEPGWRVADLGSGNGLVGLLAAVDQPRCRVVGIEMQEVLLKQGVRSARLNDLQNIRFVRADLRTPPWTEDLSCFDLVFSNPPYRKVGSGRLSPDPIRAGARHELFGCAENFARAASSLLRHGSRAVWIYLAERKDDLFRAVGTAGLEPVRFRFVTSRENEPPSLVLLEAVKGSGEGTIVEEEPLILYRKGKGRDYTDEARNILYGC
jgi:tRNA1Val (adenine37-N6)-methyltransferase